MQRYAAEEEGFVQGKSDDPAQRKALDEEELLQGKFASSNLAGIQESIQREEQPNNTGLPDRLKTGIEGLSGYSMNDVRVHYNSPKPAQLQAFAYTQGTAIHVAPGQEKYLPHEAWHVVQQKQGRVRPTLQLQGVGVNDNEGLEKEADAMGARAIGNGVTLQRKGEGRSVGGTSQVVQCFPGMEFFTNIVPNSAAGFLDIIFGSVDLYHECRNSRQLIPETSYVTIPNCTKGKVDNAKPVEGDKKALTGGTYTIEVEKNTKVTSTNDFVPEGKGRKALRIVGSVLSTLAGGVSAAGTAASPLGKFFGNPLSEGAESLWDAIGSAGGGIGYALANVIPRLKNRIFGEVKPPSGVVNAESGGEEVSELEDRGIEVDFPELVNREEREEH